MLCVQPQWRPRWTPTTCRNKPGAGEALARKMVDTCSASEKPQLALEAGSGGDKHKEDEEGDGEDDLDDQASDSGEEAASDPTLSPDEGEGEEEAADEQDDEVEPDNEGGSGEGEEAEEEDEQDEPSAADKKQQGKNIAGQIVTANAATKSKAEQIRNSSFGEIHSFQLLSVLIFDSCFR